MGPKNLPAKNKPAELLGSSSGFAALKLGGLRQYSSQKAGRNEEKTDLQAENFKPHTKAKVNTENPQTIATKQSHQNPNSWKRSNKQAENRRVCMQ